MRLVNDVEGLRAWRGALGVAPALVPTMGNLHAGHLALVKAAQARGVPVAVSIFVNPLQFGPNEDFVRYPRTLAEDLEKLASVDVDLVFAPAEADLYPKGQAGIARVLPRQGLDEVLCGASRPGHFTGVCTVVAKLFNLVQPGYAWFGEKDFQQLQVLRSMVEDLNFPVTLHAHPTVREPDGLAMSSRNRLLSPDARRVAPLLYRTLRTLAQDMAREPAAWPRWRAVAWDRLEHAGFKPEYLEWRAEADLAPPSEGSGPQRYFAAARLEGVRLIDNVPVFQG